MSYQKIFRRWSEGKLYLPGGVRGMGGGKTCFSVIEQVNLITINFQGWGFRSHGKDFFLSFQQITTPLRFFSYKQIFDFKI